MYPHKPTYVILLAMLLQLFSLAAFANDNAATLQALKDAYYQSHPGKGKFAHNWSAIPIQQYWNPKDFYKPPKSVQGEFGGEQCQSCHQGTTPGTFHAWKNSVHANLDELRKLDPGDVRFYKKHKLEEVEKSLRDQGLLGADDNLHAVGCVDCHAGVGKKSVDHAKNLILPDRAVCGTCHTDEFAQAEAEKEQTWPQNQWPKGHPSHAVDWKANVETPIWAGMPEREIAQGCDMCHNQQNKCDGCHTRHSFSVAEARKPEACATCHNGVDHNEFENFMMSKHGTIYQTSKDNWNFEAQLKDAFSKGHYTAPTCQYCHFESQGEFSHNLVRKVRWGFNPTPAIADNLHHPWFEERKQDWINTCSGCHSPSFAAAYLTAADKGTIAGLKVEQEAKHVVENLYKDGLLPGQKTNRPNPPAPEKDAPAGFFQLFWAKGNNPSGVERVHADMWEHDVIKLYKGLFHGNPGGFTYTEGWSELMKDYTQIMDADTQLRAAKARAEEQAAAEARTRYWLLALTLAVAGGGFWLYRRFRAK